MILKIVTACYALLRVILTLGVLRRTQQRQSDRSPAVSIVVAAHNEAATLPTLLDALLAQTYSDYEVIIVDDRSTDQTAQVLRDRQAAADRLRVVTIDHLPEGRTPKMHALDRGVAAARGEILLFTDADCRVPRTWIEGMAPFFAPDVGAVLGYVDLRATHRNLFEQVQALDYFAMMAMLAGATKLGQPIGASGANLGYRRTAYDQAGGFGAMPSGAVADDMLLIQRVMDRTAYRVVFCDDPRTFIASGTEPNLHALIAQRTRWMIGGGEVLGHNRALLLISSMIGTINGILLCFPALLFRRDTRRGLLALLAGRLLADALHLGVAARRFGRADLLRFVPVWSVAQPLVTLLPLLGSLRRKLSNAEDTTW